MSGIERFTCTSDKPYNRHRYELVLTTGDKHIFESWEEAQAFWFARNALGYLKQVNVLDRKKAKKPKAKGF